MLLPHTQNNRITTTTVTTVSDKGRRKPVEETDVQDMIVVMVSWAHIYLRTHPVVYMKHIKAF